MILFAERIAHTFSVAVSRSLRIVKCHHYATAFRHSCCAKLIARHLVRNGVPRNICRISKKPQESFALPFCVFYATVLAHFLKSSFLPIGKLGFRECQRRRQSDQSGYKCSFHEYRIPVSMPVQIAVASCFEQSFLTGVA